MGAAVSITYYATSFRTALAMFQAFDAQSGNFAPSLHAPSVDSDRGVYTVRVNVEPDQLDQFNRLDSRNAILRQAYRATTL